MSSKDVWAVAIMHAQRRALGLATGFAKAFPRITISRAPNTPLAEWLLPAVVLLAVLLLLLHTHSEICNAVLHPILDRTSRINSLHGNKTLSGPRYQWSHGNTLEKFFEHRQKSWEWEKQYGKIYRIWAGMFTEVHVVITTPEDVANFWSDASAHNKTFVKRGGWALSNVMGQAVGFINGERWRAVRKCVDPLLTNKIAMSQLAQINQSGVEFVARIKETRIDRSGSHTQFTVNAAKTLMPFPLLETTRIFFGDLTGEEQKEMWDIGQIFMLISITTLRAGLSRTAPTKLMYTPFQFGIGREYTKRWKAWNVKMREARSDRRQLPIMKLWQDVRAGKITETELLQTVAEATFANLDITAHVLVASCIMLADELQVQEDLVAEIDAHRNEQDNYLARKDTLLHFVILEALRLQPVLPFTFPEEATVDKVLSGFLVPKGTTVISDTHAINVRNPFWGADSTQYRPMRFKEISQNDLRYNLNTFGYGSRKCMGQFFADKQLRSVLMHLYDNYIVMCKDNSKIEGNFKTDKSTWIGMFDVELRLEERPPRC